jgi:hypothetical protein
MGRGPLLSFLARLALAAALLAAASLAVARARAPADHSAAAAWAAARARLDSRDAPAYAAWAAGDDFAETLSLYVFNVTNAADLLAGAVPALAAVGPLRVAKRTRRVNASWSDDGADVAFTPWDTFEELPVAPGALALSQVLTSLYVPGFLIIFHEYAARRAVARALGVPVPPRGAALGAALAAAPPRAARAALAALPRVARALLGACGEQAGAAWRGAAPCGLSARGAAAAAALRARVADDPGTGLIFAERPARDFFFGYSDAIFESLNILDERFPPAFPGLLHNTTAAELAVAVATAALPPGSPDPVDPWAVYLADKLGASVMRTGGRRGAAAPAEGGAAGAAARDTGSPRAVRAWNAMKRLQCCASGPCGALGAALGGDAQPAWGSRAANEALGAGTEQLFPGLAARNASAFLPLGVRALRLEATGAAAAVRGVPGLAYELAGSIFAPADDAERAEWNAFGPAGVLNVSSCSMFNAPVFLSKPYFLGGNATLNNRSGLPPGDPALHDSRFVYEPVSGALLAASERWQYNVFLETYMENAGDPKFLPVYWLSSERAAAPGFFEEYAAAVTAPRDAAAQARRALLLAAVAAAAAAALVLASAASSAQALAAAAARGGGAGAGGAAAAAAARAAARARRAASAAPGEEALLHSLNGDGDAASASRGGSFAGSSDASSACGSADGEGSTRSSGAASVRSFVARTLAHVWGAPSGADAFAVAPNGGVL